MTSDFTIFWFCYMVVMSVTICFSDAHSNIMTADFLVLSLSLRTRVGAETVVSVLFLFHALLDMYKPISEILHPEYYMLFSSS